MRTGLVHGLIRIAKGLPSVWWQRRQAERLVDGLADYPFPVGLPDRDTIYRWIEALCETPHRRPGSVFGQRAEDWLVERLSELGLQQVSKEPVPINVWESEQAALRVDDQQYSCFAVPNSAFAESPIEASLVYAGNGSEREYNRVQVGGRVVVVDVRFPTLPTGVLLRVLRSAYAISDPRRELDLRSTHLLSFVRQNFLGGASESAAGDDAYWRAYRRGAKGIVLVLKDQLGSANSHYGPYDGIPKPLPGVWLSKQDGARLIRAAKAGTSSVMTSVGTVRHGTMHNVWGTLPGQSEETILVTSHHDSPHRGAVEDGTGVAQVLTQAWAWSRVPLARRPKTMVFVLDAGHFYGSLGAHRFAEQHPEIMNRTDVLITLEHLAAKDVTEAGGRYVDNGKAAFSAMFTTPDPKVIASVMSAFRKQPPRATACIPSTFFGPAPTSDAMGYVLQSNVPVVSWIACPPYLLDEHDTLDKISKEELEPIARTVTELVKSFMVNSVR